MGGEIRRDGEEVHNGEEGAGGLPARDWEPLDSISSLVLVGICIWSVCYDTIMLVLRASWSWEAVFTWSWCVKLACSYFVRSIARGAEIASSSSLCLYHGKRGYPDFYFGEMTSCPLCTSPGLGLSFVSGSLLIPCHFSFRLALVPEFLLFFLQSFRWLFRP